LENVELPLRLLKRPDEEAARELLEGLGLGHRLHHLPSQLSGGEAQRVGIGRALIHSPQLVLADEPTGSLDARTGEAVLETLFSQLKQRRQTALIVTHSSEVARRCDRTLSLREGRLWPV
jgi:predicted ABC-type transport system involved in lysophospholipase L1 biosynthesis ATPase subunit